MEELNIKYLREMLKNDWTDDPEEVEKLKKEFTELALSLIEKDIVILKSFTDKNLKYKNVFEH